MWSSLLTALVMSATIANAFPLATRQTRLDAAATAEAQRRDNTATRAFTAVPIKVCFARIALDVC